MNCRFTWIGCTCSNVLTPHWNCVFQPRLTYIVYTLQVNATSFVQLVVLLLVTCTSLFHFSSFKSISHNVHRAPHNIYTYSYINLMSLKLTCFTHLFGILFMFLSIFQKLKFIHMFSYVVRSSSFRSGEHVHSSGKRMTG